jgi:hypothetical protein
MTRERGGPKLTGVKDHLNGKLHLIQAHDGKVTKDCAVCSNREVKGGTRETLFYCDMRPRKPGPHPQQVFCHISHSEEVLFGMQLIGIFYLYNHLILKHERAQTFLFKMRIWKNSDIKRIFFTVAIFFTVITIYNISHFFTIHHNVLLTPLYTVSLLNEKC